MDYLIFLVNLFFQVYMLFIAFRALMPWLPLNRFSPVVSFINEVTDPILEPIRKGLPPTRIGIDASPFIAIFLLFVLQQILVFFLTVP